MTHRGYFCGPPTAIKREADGGYTRQDLRSLVLLRWWPSFQRGMSCSVVHATCIGQTGRGIPWYPVRLGAAEADHGRFQRDRYGTFRPISRRRSVLYIYRIATYVICLCQDIATCRPIIVATLSAFSAAASAVPTFLELPTNQTVVEGGDATLSCNATVNGTRRPLSYRIGNGAGSTLQSVGGNITDLSLVDGVVGACVFGEYNTQLILKGVTRQADGYTVTCTVLDGIFFIAPQNEPLAFLLVICKSLDTHFGASCTIVRID